MSERREALPRPGQVEPQRLSALAALAGGQLIGADVPVSGVTASSGRVRAGDLFAGLPGRAAHGARFATAASAGGAVAVLTDRDGLLLVPPGVPVVVVDNVRARLGAVSAEIYGRPSRAVPVLGITGTSGKTTTAYLVRAGLAAAGMVSGLIGTVATLIGYEAVKTGFTTPEAPDVQALLAVMRERGAAAVAMEVSSHELTASTSRWLRSPICRRTISTSTATWTTTSPRRRGCSTDGRARRSWSSTTSGDAASRRSSVRASRP